MNLTLTLSDEQLEAIVSLVAKRLPAAQNSAAPMTVKAFHAAIGGALSPESIYRQCQSGRIRTVANCSKILIPAAELKRFLC